MREDLAGHRMPKRYLRYQPPRAAGGGGVAGAIGMSDLTRAGERGTQDLHSGGFNCLPAMALCDPLRIRSRYNRHTGELLTEQRVFTQPAHSDKEGMANKSPGGQVSLYHSFFGSLKFMSPEELLQQLEEYESRRKPRDRRPKWLKHLIQQIADLFEPLRDVARVGYDCRMDEHGWLIRMYLGTTEIIGGPKDGQIEHASFRLDLQQLMGHFEKIDRLEWYSVANAESDDASGQVRSLLSMVGTANEGRQVQLELLACPPKYAPPGMHNTAGDITHS